MAFVFCNIKNASSRELAFFFARCICICCDEALAFFWGATKFYSRGQQTSARHAD
jgi:hypothetical protein